MWNLYPNMQANMQTIDDVAGVYKILICEWDLREQVIYNLLG